MDDVWGTATTLGYFVQNYTKRQGTFAQTAEQRGYFTPFDMEVDMFELMCSYEPRMKVLPFIDGGQGTSDEISVGRKNMLSLLQANPEPGSLAGFISWWWPFTLGAAQALKQMNRSDVPLFNHYLSIQFLEAWVAKQVPVAFSCDSPFPEIGRKTGELAVKLARGEDVPNLVYRVPVITVLPEQAQEALTLLKSQDETGDRTAQAVRRLIAARRRRLSPSPGARQTSERSKNTIVGLRPSVRLRTQPNDWNQAV
nr:substrate-binding domain-containing protein [Marinicella sp. W31]MDC2875612.1 hypothetical protein [Marinicella sp. W31]